MTLLALAAEYRSSCELLRIRIAQLRRDLRECQDREAQLLLHDLAAVSSKEQYELAELRLQGYTIAEIALAQGMPKIRIRRLLRELYRAYFQLYMGGEDTARVEEKR